MACKCISEFNLISTSKCISKLVRSWPPSASLGYKISAFNFISKLTRSRPPSASLSPLDLALQVHRCVTQSRPPDASLNLLEHHLQVHLWVTWSQPPNASPHQLNHGKQVHLWVKLDLSFQVHICVARYQPPNASWNRSITASKCNPEFNSISVTRFISKLAKMRPPSTSPSSCDHGLQLHLYVLSLSFSRCSCDYAPVRSVARLAVCISIERLG